MSAHPTLFTFPDATPALNSGQVPSYLHDHRKRLRERFMRCDAESLADYELLELILFRAIPRQDIKPLAFRLLNVFGDLNRVIAANPERLKDLKGVGDAVILELKLAQAIAHRMVRSKILDRPIISSWDAVLDYCHTTMAHDDTEQFRVLFLDNDLSPKFPPALRGVLGFKSLALGCHLVHRLSLQKFHRCQVAQC